MLGIPTLAVYYLDAYYRDLWFGATVRSQVRRRIADDIVALLETREPHEAATVPSKSAIKSGAFVHDYWRLVELKALYDACEEEA